MPIELTCNCGRNIRLADALSGKRIRCPECAMVLSVPVCEARPTNSLPQTPLRSDQRSQSASHSPSKVPTRPRRQRPPAPPVEDDPYQALPPISGSRKKSANRNAVPWWPLIWAAGISGFVIAGYAAYKHLPRLFTAAVQHLGESQSPTFHGFSYKMPPSFKVARDLTQPRDYNGQRIGTAHLQAWKGSILVILSWDEFDIQQHSKNSEIEELISTSNSANALRLLHLTEGNDARYEMEPVREQTINGVTFAVADYTSTLAGLKFRGRRYCFRYGHKQLMVDGIIKDGQNISLLTVVDDICLTFKPTNAPLVHTDALSEPRSQ